MKRGGNSGDIVRIPLSNDRQAYAQLLRDPFLAVYAVEKITEIAELDGAKIHFIVAAAHWPIKERRWPIIGMLPSDRIAIEIPENFIQDWHGTFACQLIDAEGNIRPASWQECVGLEPAMSWSPEPIEARIEDARAGRENPVLRDHALRKPLDG